MFDIHIYIIETVRYCIMSYYYLFKVILLQRHQQSLGVISGHQENDDGHKTYSGPNFQVILSIHRKFHKDRLKKSAHNRLPRFVVIVLEEPPPPNFGGGDWQNCVKTPENWSGDAHHKMDHRRRHGLFPCMPIPLLYSRLNSHSRLNFHSRLIFHSIVTLKSVIPLSILL